MAPWLNAEGRLIDPTLGSEYATLRFPSAVAPLIRCGRCHELLALCVTTLDTKLRELAAREQSKGHGWFMHIRDIVLALDGLRGQVAAERWQTWTKAVSISSISSSHPLQIALV